MNRLHSPAYKTQFDRYTDKSRFISRADNLSSWTIATAEFNILLSRPGSVAVIDKLVVKGHSITTGGEGGGTDEHEEFLHFRIKVDESGGAEIGNLIVQIMNGGATAAAGQTMRVFEFKHPLVIPPGHKLTLQNINAYIGVSALCGFFPEVHGYYMSTADAVNAGLYNGLENWFCEGAITATTSNTELVAAVAGKSIQIEGYLLQGLTRTGAGDIHLTHDDATTDRTILRMYTSSGSQNYKAELFASGIEMNMPVGNSVNYTASANMAPAGGGRGVVNIWGRYTTTPNTFNPNGFFGIEGVASAVAAAGASTLTDASKEWITNALAGVTGKIVRGLGAGATFTVSSNTATVLTMSATWTANGAAGGIDTTSEFRFDVADGEKFWCAVDAGAQTTETESAFLVVPSYKNGFARIEHTFVSGDCNSAADTSPCSVILREGLGARKGSGTTITLVGGAAIPTTGLDGVNATATNVLSPWMGTQATGDVHMVQDGMGVCVDVGPPLAALASSAFADSRIINYEVSNGWTNVCAAVSGRFLPADALSTSAAANALRFQTNS